MSHTILMVDDDALFREAVTDHFAPAGIVVEGAGSLAQARLRMQKLEYELLLLDDQLPDGTGVDLLDECPTNTPALLVTGHPALKSAIAGLRRGLGDYLEKPLDLDLLRNRVLELLPHGLQAASSGGRDWGPEPSWPDAARRAAGSRAPVLFTGETGTGKSFLARKIHDASHAALPFVHVNCAALPESLIEVELFGTEAGAFTGARAKAGLLESAGRGTIFLDEIGEMPVSVQAKLLQCLESQEVRRVGSLQARPFRARVMAATNVDLDVAVSEGRFRADLRYRLEVLTVHVPALRHRSEDLPALGKTLLAGLDNPVGARIDDAQWELLKRHDWPGNIRELRNVLARSLLYAEDGVAHPARMLPSSGQAASANGEPAAVEGTELGTTGNAPGLEAASAEQSSPKSVPPMRLDALEREQILNTLERLGGHRERSADALGIGVATLRRKLHSYRQQGFGERIARIDQSERTESSPAQRERSE